MPSGNERREIERLQEENRALNEQIKLLVQTEQRFYRSQGQLDAQLERLTRLADFALGTTRLHEPLDVLLRALDVLEEAYELDWSGAVALSEGPLGPEVLAEAGVAHGRPRALALPESGRDWLLGLDAPYFGRYGAGAGPDALAGLVLALAGPVHEKGGVAVVVPLRTVGHDRPGFLATFSVGDGPRRARPDATPEQQRPFLQLLANHVAHAIDNAELTGHLRENGESLARSLESLERTQLQLLQAQKMDAIGRLAGGVAHDFNNLLTVILGYAGALSAGLPADAPQQGNVQRVLEAARRAAGLTSQLLALGRRQMRRLEDLDLGQQAAHTAELLSRVVGEDVRIDLELDKALAPIRADRAQLEQVLLNLVINARDAMPAGGRLRIATRAARASDAARCETEVDPARFAALEVADEGVGMDEATRARVFEPFFTTKSDGQGSGLGLAVVYGIVTQTEGRVFVESQPGRGTCFTVLLPYAPAGARAPAPRDAAAMTSAAPPHAPRGTILVVEDEPALREVVRATLERAGHVVLLAADGEDALAMLESAPAPPDLVLTDVMMPRLGGLGLAERLATRTPAVRVAFMSGYSEDLLASLPVGSRTFIAKPFTPQELVAFVGAQLAPRG